MKDKVIKDAMSSIENRIRHVYNQGLEDGLNDGLHDSIIINKDVYGQGYEKGSKDTWECAKKIAEREDDMRECFHDIAPAEIFSKYSATIAMAKIKEYEENQKHTEKSCLNCIHCHGEMLECDIAGCIFEPKHNIDSLILKKNAKCEKCVHKDDDFDCHNFCVPYNFDHFKEKQNNDNNSNTPQKENSSDNKEDDTYVYLYKGTFSQFKEGNSVLLSTDITYWDHNIHDDKVLKAGEIHTLKEYFPETGACLITVNNEMNKR